jgi:hypothetical protein
MAPIPKRKTERAPPVDKLLKPAIGIGLALLAYQFFKGLDAEVRMDFDCYTLYFVLSLTSFQNQTLFIIDSSHRPDG